MPLKIGQDYSAAEALAFAEAAYNKQNAEVTEQVKQDDDCQDVFMEKRMPECGVHPWLRDKDYDDDADEDNEGTPGYPSGATDAD